MGGTSNQQVEGVVQEEKGLSLVGLSGNVRLSYHHNQRYRTDRLMWNGTDRFQSICVHGVPIVVWPGMGDQVIIFDRIYKLFDVYSVPR